MAVCVSAPWSARDCSPQLGEGRTFSTAMTAWSAGLQQLDRVRRTAHLGRDQYGRSPRLHAATVRRALRNRPRWAHLPRGFPTSDIGYGTSVARGSPATLHDPRTRRGIAGTAHGLGLVVRATPSENDEPSGAARRPALPTIVSKTGTSGLGTGDDAQDLSRRGLLLERLGEIAFARPSSVKRARSRWRTACQAGT